MKRKISHYSLQVEYSGTFPFDMLRYDRCWPATERDALAMARDTHSKRTVTLMSNKEPTFGRWRSFGVNVVEIMTHYTNGASVGIMF